MSHKRLFRGRTRVERSVIAQIGCVLIVVFWQSAQDPFSCRIIEPRFESLQRAGDNRLVNLPANPIFDQSSNCSQGKRSVGAFKDGGYRMTNQFAPWTPPFGEIYISALSYA